MKIALCAQDDRLAEKLISPSSTANSEQLWETFGTIDELCHSTQDNKYEYIIVSDRLTDYERLADTLETLKDKQRKAKLLVLLSNRHHAFINEQYMKLCLTHDCSWVPPGRSVDAICDEVRRHIGEDEATPRRKIVLFLGSTPNIGTTVLAFGTAWRLAATTEHKIGYLCLNLKSSKLHRYIGRDHRVRSLDMLRAELKSGTLREERLLQYCDQMKDNPNLHILYGNMLREQAEFFSAEEIEHLLDTARSAFDVCIVDVNAYWDNAATICGIIHSDTRIMVTTGEITHFQEDLNRWLNALGGVFGVEAHMFDLVLNRFDKTAALKFGGRPIGKETKMHVLSEIGEISELREAINRGELIQLLQQSDRFRAGVSPIAETIILLHRLQHRPLSRRKPWLKRILAGPAAVS